MQNTKSQFVLNRQPLIDGTEYIILYGDELVQGRWSDDGYRFYDDLGNHFESDLCSAWAPWKDFESFLMKKLEGVELENTQPEPGYDYLVVTKRGTVFIGGWVKERFYSEERREEEFPYQYVSGLEDCIAWFKWEELGEKLCSQLSVILF